MGDCGQGSGQRRSSPGQPDDLARIDRHVIDSADAEALIGDQPVLAVQIQDVKTSRSEA